MNWLKKLLLMLWEAFKKANESELTPIPKPPEPPKPPVPPEEKEEHLVICDLDLIPNQMRAGGITGRDNILYYGLAVAWAGRRGWSLVTSEIEEIYNQREAIVIWMDKHIDVFIKTMRSNPKATATAIEHDGPDRLGHDLGPEIMDRFKEFGDRIQMGTI